MHWPPVSENRNDNELNSDNSQINDYNQNSDRKVSKPNPFLSNGLKSYYRIQSPNFIKNESSNISFNANDQTNENASKKITDSFNWQSKFSSVKERSSVLFNNDCMSDLTFLVGDCDNSKGQDSSDMLKIPVHKHVLASSSPVFYAMLYGNLAEKKSIINLPEDDPQGILNLLR